MNTRTYLLLAAIAGGAFYLSQRAMAGAARKAGPYDRFASAIGQSTFPGAGAGQNDAYNGG